MFDEHEPLMRELARRARHLIRVQGSSYEFDNGSSYKWTDLTIGDYYLRVDDKNYLDIQVRSDRRQMVFVQCKPGTPGRLHLLEDARILLDQLKKMMVLDDLASV
jgi:hypothetical protein